ncbi:hypothetical protein ABT288_36610 [Streptomyces sp. NPDC001093]|uniref:hypothetical protein n=1 Tax=Streptomyces sp. NPDC001093 TaxID=3154376 RepID=UPI0033227AC5
MLETVNGIMIAPLFGFVAPVTLGIFLLGALTVFFARGRGRAYELDAHRLHRDLHELLAPLRPEPLEGSRRLDPS